MPKERAEQLLTNLTEAAVALHEALKYEAAMADAPDPESARFISRAYHSDNRHKESAEEEKKRCDCIRKEILKLIPANKKGARY